MASRASVTVEGMGDLERALRRLADDVSGAHLMDAVLDGADVLKQGMEARAPRLTGNLASEIETVPGKSSPQKADASVGPSMEAFYGTLVELGTSDTAAQPFMRPALEEGQAEIVAAVGASLRRRVMSGVH